MVEHKNHNLSAIGSSPIAALWNSLGCSECNAVVSVPALGAGSRVFDSRHSEKRFV